MASMPPASRASMRSRPPPAIIKLTFSGGIFHSLRAMSAPNSLEPPKLAMPIFLLRSSTGLRISLRATNFCKLLFKIAPTMTMSPPESTALTGAMAAILAE